MNSNEWTPAIDANEAPQQGAAPLLADAASDLTQQAASGIQRTKQAAADGLKAASSYLREHLANSGDGVNLADAPMVGRLAANAAQGIDAAASFVQDLDLNQARDEVASVIRRYPYQSLGVGIGLGLLLGRALRR